MPLVSTEVRLKQVVHVTERPHLVGEIVEVVSESFVKVEFPNVEMPVGCNIARLTAGQP